MYYETVIIGAGLSGLRKAIELDEASIDSVLIIDYEENMGGFLSKKPLKDSATIDIMEKARKLSYPFWGKSTAISIHVGDDKCSHEVIIQTANGLESVKTEQIIIATGAREKPRGSYKITGTRPAGEMTPTLALGLLQRNFLPGFDPLVIVDNEIAEAAVESLESYPECHVTSRNAEDVELLDIQGYPRVSEVTLRDKKDNMKYTISCDTLIFSYGKLPNIEFLSAVDIELNEDNYIYTDEEGLTSIPGIYAFGDCSVQKSSQHV